MASDFLDLNLLPPERRYRSGPPVRTRNAATMLGLGLLAFALLTIIPLWLTKLSVDRRLSQLATAVETTRIQVRDTDSLLAREAQLQQQIQTTLIKADTLERQAARIKAEQPALSELLQPLAQALPPRVTIATLTVSEAGVVRVAGEGGSATLVLEFAQEVERLPNVRRVSVVGMDRLGGDAAPTAVSYTIEIERETSG